MSIIQGPLRLAAGWRRLALLGFARGGASLLGFASVALLAQALTPEALGRWSLALAVQGYALHLGEFGLRSVVTAEAGGVGTGLPRLLRRYLALRLVLSALALAAAVLAAVLLAPGEAGLIAWVTLSIVAIALQLDWLALVDDRAGLASGLLLVRPAALLGFLALWPGPLTLPAAAACFLAAWWLAAALSWTALRHRPGSQGIAAPLPSVPAMLGRGARLAAVALTNQAQLSADLLVVGACLGAAAAGDYYLASQIAVAGLLFANAAGQIALARLAMHAARPDDLGQALAGEARRLAPLAAAGTVLLGLVAAPLLPALFGAEHEAAAAALWWLLPWFLLQHATTLLQAALAAARREGALLRGNLVMLLVLAPALVLAAANATLAGFALARSLAELARLAALLSGLRADGMWRVGPTGIRPQPLRAAFSFARPYLINHDR